MKQGHAVAGRQTVAVIFGGRSPEHDVSIKTGLQALYALDSRCYEGFPVYIGLDGRWWVGEPLRDEANYLPSEALRRSLTEVRLAPAAAGQGGHLVAQHAGGWWSRPRTWSFDVALLALHGLNGEDGRLQGLLEFYNVPYTGMRALPSAVLMDKAMTKRMLADSGIAVLPCALIDRPPTGLMPAEDVLRESLAGLPFPLIVKPNHLGSSIGVARVESIDQLRAVLPTIFKLDTQAVVERCVPNLVEYNLAVMRRGGQIHTSAIERPKSSGELLDFKQKYLSGAGKAGGTKTGGSKGGRASEGMLSLTREINPALPESTQATLRQWARECFARVGGTGAPRIDFLCDAQTGEFWLNEVNPCPGSFGFFLWEAAAARLDFPDLLGTLIDEAVHAQRLIELPADPTVPEARLFGR
jgi:D-alanine-D-alanine ligase